MTGLKLDFPGLLKEKLPSGNYRYRVRMEGNPNRRVRLHIDPDHKDFPDHYRAARCGIEIKPDDKTVVAPIRDSVKWLVTEYLTWFKAQVKGGVYSPDTLKQRKSKLAKLDSCGDYAMNMPQAELLKIRDTMSDTPGSADNFIKSMRAMYTWAVDRRLCDVNPATGIGKLNPGMGGAKPWTIDNLQAYRDAHPPGTPAHLCLTLFMFTACRISDAIVLGCADEFNQGGIRGLGWQPKKKGSAFVKIPMLPPLFKATRAAKVQGNTYLLTEYGHSFRSPEGLRNRFRKWCDDAGLYDLSSHGIRKAAGHLLAQEGCSQYQIMAIHGHTQAKTSEIYTKGIERWKLAVDAMRTLEGMEW